MVFLKAKMYKLEEWFKVKGGEYYAKNNDLTCKIRDNRGRWMKWVQTSKGKSDMEEMASAGTT